MKGRVLLVGGSGGLGEASARLLSSEGTELVISFRADAVRAGRLSSIARILQADITLQKDRLLLLDQAGALDGLVVFAGNAARVTAQEERETKLQLSHDDNYAGPILLARETSERMRAAKTAGSIVLFSTMQAISLFPNSFIYAGSKAALIHSARILAKEVRGDNIRVNVIAPGVMAAGMAEASIATGKYDRYVQERTIPRFGRSSDIARTVRFLLEPDSYITGQVISVDGGITL